MASDLVFVCICREFSEMPGLLLTDTQVARLCALDLATAREALECLVTIGFLRADDGDAAALPGMTSLRHKFRRAH